MVFIFNYAGEDGVFVRWTYLLYYMVIISDA